MASLILADDLLPSFTFEGFSFEGQDRNSFKSGRITNEEWESVKAEIEQIYIDQDQTLAATMGTIQNKYGLAAR